jgi:hypothetical protein
LPEIFASYRNALARATGRLGPADLDESVDPPDHLDEAAMFRFGTVGAMILTLSAYTCFLAGEAPVVRLALGKAAVDDPRLADAFRARGLFDRSTPSARRPSRALRNPLSGLDRSCGFFAAGR